MKLKKLAGALSFAHLLGLPAAAENGMDGDDDDKQREGESDDDYAQRMEERDKAHKAKRAAEDDDDKQREGESDDDYAQRMEERDKARKAKKARGEGDDDDDDSGDGDDEDARAARAAERARCARIVAFGMKNGRTAQACMLAFDTTLTSRQAIGVLRAAAVDGRVAGTAPSLAERMAGVHVANPGVDAGPGSDAPRDERSARQATVQAILAASAKARGEA